MRHLPVILIAGLLTSVVTLAEEGAPRKATAPAPTCDTVFDGVAGGDLSNAANWSNGLPDATRAGCFPDDVNVGRVPRTRQTVPMSGLMTRPTGQTTLQLEGKRMSARGNARASPVDRGFARAEARGSGIPSPTANGSCCLGATCLQTDAFDCRELGGYFLEGVGPCSELLCATGACCVTEGACVDDDGGCGDMDEALCGIINGNYLGGAQCDASDPCQRFRIPEGFEIVELTLGWEALMRRNPHLDNCGEVVVNSVLVSGVQEWAARSGRTRQSDLALLVRHELGECRGYSLRGGNEMCLRRTTLSVLGALCVVSGGVTASEAANGESRIITC